MYKIKLYGSDTVLGAIFQASAKPAHAHTFRLISDVILNIFTSYVFPAREDALQPIQFLYSTDLQGHPSSMIFM